MKASIPSPTRLRRILVAALVVVAHAATAWAQGYTVTTATRLVEARPPSATRVDIDSVHPAKASATVNLPFAFQYYGNPYATLVVSAHGWLLPGANEGFANAADPTSPHGQDAATGAFPYGAGVAGAGGIIAPLWTRYAIGDDGPTGSSGVWTWTSGDAPARRFVVSWENVSAGPGPRMTVQVQLLEGPGRIVFAYATSVVTGAASPTAKAVCGFDEPGGARFTSPMPYGAATTGPPSSDFVFDPRTVLFNSPGAVKTGVPVAWQDIRRESITAPGSAKGACYVAKGRGWFFVPDRALQTMDPKQGQRPQPQRKGELADEDRATFHGETGDAERWVRQVLDGKAILVPKDGGATVRVWFRIIEYFTIDEWGVAGEDDHIWNLRRMLVQAFGRDDPRSAIENYVAWRGMARSRLSVVKVFDVAQKDDAGRQFDTNRKNEYVLWCARFRTGAAAKLGALETPRDGWTRFFLKEEDRDAPHHADKNDLRDVADPNYVDGGYEYVIRNDHSLGWEALVTAPRAAPTDEPFDR
jgi:hypothetical protein